MREPKFQTWQVIYDRHAAEVEAFVRGRAPAGEADDLLQEVWSALTGALEEQELRDPRAWLFRVARNRLTDLYRRRAARPPIQDITAELEVTDAPVSIGYLSDEDVDEEITAALALLPEAQREVFVRNELGGETLREIAVDLGIPLKTAISRKGYARRRLQGALREVYEDYFGID
ncbi:RNA polymerase sigma factor [Neolewinella litorea]|uniref:Sigma-70 family RNA polymerase sigma factor n=1 Tax=Neolewinella litorea TaxID=2562452 RepID=A0A4S4NVV6_9BACT|nr:sigma-70 family RNA polymerase sigma factor [Neolewinella litorea]THH40400.1 sigma-70 family RNA polymerase sigma factor [Neolewinella litorea]